MPRTKTKVASKKNKPIARRAEGKTQISISLPDALVKQVDQLAALENRNRSNYIVTSLEQVVTREYAAR